MIIAIDPGISTGIAWHDVEGYHTLVTKDEGDIWSLLVGIKWDCVIYEDFVTSGRIGAPGLATVRLIGGILALCKHMGLQTCKHMPQARYPFQLEARKKLHGAIIHEQDALAHLLRYEYDMEKNASDVLR